MLKTQRFASESLFGSSVDIGPRLRRVLRTTCPTQTIRSFETRNLSHPACSTQGRDVCEALLSKLWESAQDRERDRTRERDREREERVREIRRERERERERERV